jgi:hypothetical protein
MMILLDVISKIVEPIVTSNHILHEGPPRGKATDSHQSNSCDRRCHIKTYDQRGRRNYTSTYKYHYISVKSSGKDISTNVNMFTIMLFSLGKMLI